MTTEQHRDRATEDAAPAQLWVLGSGMRKPVPDLVAERVVELVDRGDLAVGDRLPTEPELARRLQVARSSVRTALQKLQAQGILQVERGRGWFVAADSRRASDGAESSWPSAHDADLLEVMQVRIALEGMATALAAVNCSSGDLDEIAKLNQAHRDAPLDDPDALLRTDQDFHEAIVGCAGSGYLRTVYGTVTPLLASWRASSFGSPEVLRRSATDHEQILWQLRRRDEMGARLAMTTHLLGQHDAIASDQQRRGARTAPRPKPGLATFIDDDTQ